MLRPLIFFYPPFYHPLIKKIANGGLFSSTDSIFFVETLIAIYFMKKICFPQPLFFIPCRQKHNVTNHNQYNFDVLLFVEFICHWVRVRLSTTFITSFTFKNKVINVNLNNLFTIHRNKIHSFKMHPTN